MNETTYLIALQLLNKCRDEQHWRLTTVALTAWMLGLEIVEEAE